ncbi:hypothetical protein [Roseobacter sinensis]|uniref:Lipoprotein n=1 Tax=Roseobacter sinensis TaxID=2931391 RepID=A0ABT3BHS1_9RHOB|nr:hypothetical protein [Roseobacter sp. WL0113]MCV3272738.1 hypothetical protein [Roseobacter sp. WL0113]
MEPLTDPLTPLEMAQAIHARLRPIEAGETETQKFSKRTNGDVYVVSATRIHPRGEAPPVRANQLAISIVTYQLTETYFARPGAPALIDSFVQSAEMPARGQRHIRLKDIDRRQSAHPERTPPRSGGALVRAAGLLISLGLILCLGLSSGVTLLAKRWCNQVEMSSCLQSRRVTKGRDGSKAASGFAIPREY